MPISPTSSCTHDLGPGTSVCLRCRQERREAIRAHQQRLFALGGGVAVVLVAVYVLGASAANAVRVATRPVPAPVVARASVVVSSTAASEAKQQGHASADSAPGSSVAPANSPASAPVSAPVSALVSATPAAARGPWAPVIREGRTDLPDGLIVERAGDSVVVDFDTQDARTRRRDKFEDVVRRTLPLVYGARVDSLLGAIPSGGIVDGADLVTELPVRGLHLRLPDGFTLDLWPETRPGQDGPLVVSYRTRVTRN